MTAQQADVAHFEAHLGQARCIPSVYRLGIGAKHIRFRAHSRYWSPQRRANYAKWRLERLEKAK